MLCVLGVQAKYRGLTVYWLEAWLERAIGWLKRRSRDRVVHDAAHLAVSVELDNRGMQRAAAVLGKFKQEEGMDGVPRLLLGYSKLSELLHAPAAATHCAMYGDGQEMAADLWARIKVGSCKQQCQMELLPARYGCVCDATIVFDIMQLFSVRQGSMATWHSY